MRIEIGRMGDGGVADVVTAVARRLVLVVDPTRGKTTAVRHMVRWLLANGLRRGVVWAEGPYQYSDLATMLHEVATPIAPRGTPASAVHVVDNADLDPPVHLRSLREMVTRPSRVTVTSFGPVVAQLWHGESSPETQILGLIGPRRDGPDSLEQGRLDWSPWTGLVCVNELGPAAHSPHRWQPDTRAA